MLTAVLSLLLASLAQIFAIETIEAKGSKFFKSGGAQWFVKGTSPPHQKHSLPSLNILKASHTSSPKMTPSSTPSNAASMPT